MIQLGYLPARIDLLSTIDGVQFQDCYASRLVMTVGAIELPVISIEAFRANKLAVGRLKDLADLEALDKREIAE